MVVVWLLVKLLVLYTATLLFSISIFVYLNQTILPPHQTLKYPLVWHSANMGVVELERGQRLGGNFNLQSGIISAEKEKYSVVQGSVSYDISLLLKYPDRPEIADLGNLRIVMNLVRRDGEIAGKIENVQALRYETRLLRLVRDVLSIPDALWRDSGSERTERIQLATRLVDDSNISVKREKSFGVDQFNSSKKASKVNPIDRIEISISPVPPLHSIHLEILANLSPLQHILFHWRVPTAVLIIGGCTSMLWFLVSIYALIEVVRILLKMRKEYEGVESLDSASVRTEIVEIQGEVTSETLSLESVTDDEEESTEPETEVVSLHFPPAETVANFIGDLRQRKLQSIQDEDDDDVSKYNSDVEDQSVPEGDVAEEKEE